MTRTAEPFIVSQDMRVLDIISRCGKAEAVFRSYDAAAGECICCRALFDTLEELSVRYRLDLERLLSDLNSTVKEDRL